jgi:hypothetical protein
MSLLHLSNQAMEIAEIILYRPWMTSDEEMRKAKI